MAGDQQESTCGCFKPDAAGSKVFSGIACSVAFNPLIWLLWFLDFMVWLVYFLVVGWIIAFIPACASLCCTWPCIAKTAGKKVKDDTWRAGYLDTDHLVTGPAEGITTAWECFESAFKKYKNTRCMGTRTYLGEWRRKEGDKIVKKIFGKTEWATYGNIHDRAMKFGKGLRSVGMEPSKSTSKAEFEASTTPDTLLLWEDTCADWMTCLAGAHSQSLVVATSYATLGIDGVVASISQCKCPVVVCNRKQVKTLLEAMTEHPAEMASVKTLVYTDLYCGGGNAFGPDSDSNTKLTMDGIKMKPDKLPALVQDVPDDVSVISYEELIEMGGKSDFELSPPKPDNMAVVMYTSGSTGKPKGVVIGHKNICASVGGMQQLFAQFGKEGGETYIAYLPAAHILELVAEIACISFGSEIGFADPRTISSTGACRFHVENGTEALNHTPSLTVAPGAIQEFKPSVMVAVPKIWEILKKGIESKIKDSSCLVRHLFEAAFAACRNAAGWRSCPLLGLIFSKSVGSMIGGRLKIGISGGGPISEEVQTFCRVAMSVPIVQGYALTETTCGGSVQLITDREPGVVGAPLSSVEMKLEDCAEINDRKGNPYLTSNNTHWDGSACSGRGEVMIRGPSVSLGYYAAGDDEEEVKDLIKKTENEFGHSAPNQGKEFHWFHTGDIGLFTPDGRLKLIDRKKNLVKLKGGEYVAIEQMESVYGGSVFVNMISGGIMCHGDGDLDKPDALVQAEMSNIKTWAKDNDIKTQDPDELCKDKAVIKMVLDDLNKIGSGKVAANERLAAIALISGTGPAVFPGSNTSAWNPENGFLTASNKIDRNNIKNGTCRNGVTSPCYADVLQELRAKQGVGTMV